MISDNYIHIQLSSSLILSSIFFLIVIEGFGVSSSDIFFPIFLFGGILLFLFGLTTLIDQPVENIYKELPRIYNINFIKWLITCVIIELGYILVMQFLLS
jgi:hypothetical protein